MLPHWSPIVMFAVMLFVAVAIAITIASVGRKRQTSARRVKCPESGEVCTVSVVEDSHTGRALHVLGCTGWSDWRKTKCGAPCVDMTGPDPSSKRCPSS